MMMTTEARDLANIGPRGQRQRRVMGLAALALAAGLLGVLYLIDANRWWRVLDFPLLWFGMLGVLQARARTCVALAARRTCDTELMNRGLSDAEAEALARRGRAILRRATIMAGVLTLLALMLPSLSAP